MAKDRALFVLMCRLLAEPDSGPPPDDADLDRSESEWARLIYIANLHYAAPLLHDAVYARGLLARLPDDIRGYLVAIRHANDSRMMVDVDVLVPSGVEDVAWNAMADLGYRAVDDDDYSRAHQMNAIHREGAVATIEIHRTPGPQRTLVTVDEAYADSALVSAESGRCRVMSTDHSVRHALFHGQVQDFHYWFARPQLRTLLDLRRYIDTHGPDIDWAGVVRSFDDEGYGRVVEGTLALLHAWLGVEPPPAVPLTKRSRRYVERCTGRLNRAERELTFWQRWIGWVGVNMLPKRLAFRHRLEDTGRLGRLPVLAARQAAFLAKMSTWPARRFRRNRRGA
jgi:hypothetical protein